MIKSSKEIKRSLKNWSIQLYRLNFQKKDLKLCKYIDHKYHNTPGNFNPFKYMIKISMFESVAPEY